MTNAERVLQIATEVVQLESRLATLRAELGSLVLPDKRGPGRPPAGVSVAAQVEAAFAAAESGRCSIDELAAKVPAPRKQLSAALSFLMKKGKVERVEKGIYGAKT